MGVDSEVGEGERVEGMVDSVKMGRLVGRVEVVQGREVGEEVVAGAEVVAGCSEVVVGDKGSVVVSVGARTYAVRVPIVKPPGLTCNGRVVSFPD